jgi:drug/metabolite transporter (DMT)-like permease
MTTGRWKLGLLLTLITVSMWSTLPLFLQAAVKFIAPLNLNFMRFAGSATLLGIILSLRHSRPRREQFKPALLPLLFVAVLGLAGNYALYLWGVSQVSASAAQVVIQLAPAMLAAGSIVIFKECFSWVQGFGFFMLLVGLGTFFNHRWLSLLAAFDTYVMGLLLVLLSAFAWVAYALAQKKLLSEFKSPQLMLVIYISAALMFAPFASFSQLQHLAGWQWLVFLTCVVNTVIAYGAFAEAMNHWEASRVSAVLALGPLGTISCAAVAEKVWPGAFVYEPINGLSIVGAVVVVVGSSMVALARRPR